MTFLVYRTLPLPLFWYVEERGKWGTVWDGWRPSETGTIGGQGGSFSIVIASFVELFISLVVIKAGFLVSKTEVRVSACQCSVSALSAASVSVFLQTIGRIRPSVPGGVAAM